MAKLYFYYSAMNAGKSTMLLQSNYNYHERGMRTYVLTPELDNRFGTGRIASRIGLQADAVCFNQADDLFHMAKRQYLAEDFHCLLLDEAQFLTRRQVRQLSDVCDDLDVPVLAYGIRTDFLGNLFEGSMELLAWADVLVEIKTIDRSLVSGPAPLQLLGRWWYVQRRWLHRFGRATLQLRRSAGSLLHQRCGQRR